MKTLIYIALCCILLTACSTTKEMRRSNRAARKLERLVDKYPELRRTDTLLLAINMRTPVIHGRIIQPMLYPIPGETRTITIPGEPVNPGTLVHSFDDELLTARVELNPTTGMATLEYTIKPIPVDTNVRVVTNTIQATEYKALPLKWWQSGLMWLGILLIIIIALYILRNIAYKYELI